MTKSESLFEKKSSYLIDKFDYTSGNENGRLFHLNSREKAVIYNNPYRRNLDFQHLMDSPKKAKKYAKGNLISQASSISQGTYVPNSHKPIYDWKLKQNAELAAQEAKPEPEAQPIPEPEPKLQPKRKRPKKTKTPKKEIEHPSTYINKEPSSPPPSEAELTTDNALNTYYLERELISSTRGKKCSDCVICKQLRARPSKTMEHSYMNQMLRQRKKIELRHYYKQMMLRKCQLDKKLQAQRELENLLHPC
ncbi:hypothetical protein KR215_003504 [Drosophila sulfurigaster]|nr:hypothetical protein KR215_003504 [Drosophila sulfurigaster]